MRAKSAHPQRSDAMKWAKFAKFLVRMVRFNREHYDAREGNIRWTSRSTTLFEMSTSKMAWNFRARNAIDNMEINTIDSFSFPIDVQRSKKKHLSRNVTNFAGTEKSPAVKKRSTMQYMLILHNSAPQLSIAQFYSSWIDRSHKWSKIKYKWIKIRFFLPKR